MSSSYETVNYSVDGAVALIALNRPDSLNAFNGKLCADLLAAMQQAEADENVRVVVLAGEGRAFSSGADLADTGLDGDIGDLLDIRFKPSLDLMARSHKCYIAAVQGACAGIAAAYAMNCDLAVMEDSAYLYQAFAAIGLIPDGGNHFHLVHALGYKRAYQAIVEGAKIPADACERAGIVNRVVADGSAGQEALAWAAKLAQGAPRTLRFAKEVLRAAQTATAAEVFEHEGRRQNDCATSEDTKNAVASFFRKEKPVFTGA